MSTEHLTEGINNPLVTPEFTGTDEEIIAALNYWNALVMHVRSLANNVTAYANKEAIITHLEREVSLIKAEVENVSAKVVQPDGESIPQMRQPAQPPEPAVQADIAHPEPKVVDLSPVANESLSKLKNKLRSMAGIKQVKESRLQQAIERMNAEDAPPFEESVTVVEDGKEVVIDTTRLARIAGVPSARELRARKR